LTTTAAVDAAPADVVVTPADVVVTPADVVVAPAGGVVTLELFDPLELQAVMTTITIAPRIIRRFIHSLSRSLPGNSQVDRHINVGDLRNAR
jgi:regulator of RNase E activity RraA